MNQSAYLWSYLFRIHLSDPGRTGDIYKLAPQKLQLTIYAEKQSKGTILSYLLIDWFISACQTEAIGVANRLLDHSFSASSWSWRTEPHKGRLNGDGAWSPSNDNDPENYLQIDLGGFYFICAVATQGHPRRDEWTTSYKLQLLRTEWTIYKENSREKVWETYMWTSYNRQCQ